MGPAPLTWTPEERQNVAQARVGRLATVRPDGSPHVVPVTFALDGDRLLTAVDRKPKTTTALQRLANLEAEPRASLLVDHYDEDWRQLWWLRLDGLATVVRDEAEVEPLVDRLAEKYEHYCRARPHGPVIVLAVQSVRSWSAAR